jgi:hypothetical protein
MKAALSVLAYLAVALVLVVSVQADDKDKDKGGVVTLKGKICCAKCELKEEPKCMTVIVVKEDGKDVVYYLDDKAGKKYHKEICTEAKEGTIKGKKSEKDGKKIITVTELEWKK